MSDTAQLVSQFSVKINGTNLSEDLYQAVAQITIESSLHLPDVAILEINDSALKWIDSRQFELGNKIVITASFNPLMPSLKPTFDGEIVEIEPVFEDGTQRLIVRAFDRLHRLARGGYVRSFVNVTDSDLARKIAVEAGLKLKAETTPQVHEYVMQAGQTNLEFLQGRAAALGLLLYVDGETLCFDKPSNLGPALSLAMLEDLQEFRPRLSSIGQVNTVQARGWDPKTKKAVVGQAQQATTEPKVGNGSSGGAVAKKAFGMQAEHFIFDQSLRTQAAATKVAQATLDRLSSRFIEAEGRAIGNPKLRAGISVNITGVGTRFGGTYFVTSTTHIYEPSEGYATRFTVSGLQPSTLLSILAPDDPQPRSTNNLVVAVVTDNNDPENLGRVKVQFPWLTEQHASHWSRVLSIGGGPDRGLMVLPEVHDEVLVGFEMGNIDYPYVLGGLWNGKDAPPRKSNLAVKSGKVELRVFRSRSGHEIMIDDSDKGGITIIDKNKNQIVINVEKDTITLKCKGDMSFETDGNLSFRAKGRLTVQADGEGQIKAKGLKLDGGMSPTEIKGMGVKVEGGGGTVDIKGSLINLN